MSGLNNKLTLYQRNLAARDFFSSLGNSRSGSAISNADIDAYSKHLQEFKPDMEVRFQNVFQLEVPDWIIDSFCDIIFKNGILEEELITLKCDLELKPKFKISYQSFWLQNENKERYPYAWDRFKLFPIAFSITYLLERVFSAVITLLKWS